MIYRSLFSGLLIFFLISCKHEALKTAEISAERIPIDESLEANKEIEEFIRPFSEHINKTLDSVVAYNPQDLNKSDGELNTAIGNLMADIVMEQAAPVFKS